MTLSTSFRSIVRGRQDSSRRDDQHAHALMRRLQTCRKSLSPAEVSLPAPILAGAGIASLVREHRLPVDVRSIPELSIAVSLGVHPWLITVHTDTLTVAEVQRVASQGVGRVVLGTLGHIDLFGDAGDEREQNVLLRMRSHDSASVRPGFVFNSPEADLAVARVLNHRRLNLVGLYSDVDSAAEDFVSYPAAVGDLIAQMEHIRRQRGLLLTCLGVGGGTFFATDDEHTLCDLASRVDESVDDACATLRFPRPVVVIAAGTEVTGRVAAVSGCR